MYARSPHHSIVVLLIALALAFATTGCPGSLEDPDRFGEPDASGSGGGGAGGSGGSGGSGGNAGSDAGGDV